MKDIQQLIKKNSQEGRYEDIFPKTFTDAVRDRNTNDTITEILAGFNMYFIAYTGSVATTRLQVPIFLRKQGLWITYVKYDGTVVSEWYNTEPISDEEWQKDDNWQDFFKLIKDNLDDLLKEIDKFPTLIQTIINSVTNWMDKNAEDLVIDKIEDYIKSIDLESVIQNAITEWFTNNTAYIKDLIKEEVESYLDGNIEPLIGQYFEAVVRYMNQNERVIANALARHEQAITELQAG